MTKERRPRPDRAVEFAVAVGARLVPLRGKVPVGGRRWYDRLVDVADVDHDGAKARNYGIYLGPGEGAPFGLLVLDLDATEEDSAANYGEIVRHATEELGALAVRSGHEGGNRYHLYWRHDGRPVSGSAHNFGGEVKHGFGVHQQCVAPGSVHPDSGRRYKWLNPGCPLTDCPEVAYRVIRGHRAAGVVGGTPVELPPDVKEALAVLDVTDAFTWVRVGMALKRAGGDKAFNLWVSWSQTSTRDRDRALTDSDFSYKWKSFTERDATQPRATLQTLYHLATAGGWRPTGETLPLWVGDVHDAAGDEWFWNSSPRLTGVNAEAEVTHTNPMALLVCELTLAGAATHWAHRLVVRGRTSHVGLYTILTGPSGSGKSSTVQVALDRTGYSDPELTPYTQVGPRSGEALIDAFMTGTPTSREFRAGQALQVVDEYESWASRAKAHGSSLQPVERTAWTGGGERQEALGSGRRWVTAHQYTLASVMCGTWPQVYDMASTEDGVGNSNRRIMVDVTPHNPRTMEEILVEVAEEVGGGEPPAPTVGRSPMYPPEDPGAPVPVGIHRAALREVLVLMDAMQAGVALPPWAVSVWHGDHTGLLRLKVAACLAVLNRTHSSPDPLVVGELEWAQSEYVMAASKAAKTKAGDLYREEQAREEERRRTRDFMKAKSQESGRLQALTDRTRTEVLKVLEERGGQIPLQELKKLVGGAYRDHCTRDLMDRMKEEGLVDVARDRAGPGPPARLISLRKG